MDIDQKEYNVLLLGETQSGKSTLIEALKLEPIDRGLFLEDDQEDYIDELNKRKDYLLERGDPTAVTATFNLIDTPGLNDTAKFDESNLAIIFQALEAVKSVHLVVITVSSNPFTEGLQNALKAYIDLFPEFNSNLVFLHTRIDYGKLHHADYHFINSFKEKRSTLHQLAGRDSVPYLLIDNDLDSTRTIRNCITKNTLRELLAMAKLNQPVPLQVMVVNKTRRMQTADSILKDKYEKVIAEREATLGVKDKEQTTVLAKIGSLKAGIQEYELRLGNIDRDRNFQKDKLFLIHEERYDQNWGFLKRTESKKTQMSYPSMKVAATPSFIPHVIDHVDTQAHNVEILSHKGGKGHKEWSVKFHRNRYQNGKFHVKIYIEKSKMFAKQMEEFERDDKETRGKLRDRKRDLEMYEQDVKEVMNVIGSLLVDLKMNRYLLSRVSMQQMESTVFQALVEANVFVHQDSETAANLERYYKENMDKLETKNSTEKVVDATPVNNTEETNDAYSSMSGPTNSCNILFLGSSQSGKSTLIEFLKKYADPRYEIQRERIGNSFYSQTQDVSTFTIQTNLPSFFVSKAGVQVDYDAFRTCYDEVEYEEVLNDRKNYQLEREEPSAAQVFFNLIDTPGLDDTSKFDETNIAIIFRALRSIKSINLVVITLSDNAFTEGLQDALKAYVDLLPEFAGNIVFVHTKFDYAKLHPDETEFANGLLKKKRFLRNLTGLESPRHLLIDNEIDCKRPIRICMTQNKLRRILALAKFHKPIQVQFTHINKTPRMRNIDEILRERCRKVMEVQEGVCLAKDMNLHLPSVKRMEYPGPKAKEPDFVAHILDHVESFVDNVEDVKEEGGKGFKYWSVTFRRKKFRRSSYHVKFYIERRKVFAAEIKNLKEAMEEIKTELRSRQADLEVFLNKLRVLGEDGFVRQVLDDVKQSVYLIYCTERPQIDFQEFDAMVAEDVYVRNDGHSSKNLEEFFLKRRTISESLERDPECAGQEEVTDAPDTIPFEIGSYSKDVKHSLDAIIRVLALEA
ncbi:hypothetical protein BG000_008243 [Podila horticola]|nr:hypothetical protein BG000_008243 [Podila horticola]